MAAALMITMRESLEASLVVGIMLAFLSKTENLKQKSLVWYGALAGLLVSVILAWVFQNYLGGFEGRAEELYEGFAMLFAAGLLTWMILWMITQRHGIKKNLENKVGLHLRNSYPMGIFLLSFVGVAREGIETVIFLQAAVIQGGISSTFWGGILGIFIAVSLAYLLFKGIARFSIKKFFTVTSILLVLFAAGLVAHGVHELQEAGVLPIYVEEVWNLNPAVSEDGVYPIWHENGPAGAILKGVFGYNANPSLIEVLSYFVYLMVIGGIWWRLDFLKSK